jgi:hypothetical protein
VATKKSPSKKSPTARRAKPRTAGRASTTARKRAPKAAAKKPPAKAASRRAAASAAPRSNTIAVVTKRPPTRARADHIPRRCVFVDVENTSSEEDLFEVLDALKLDRAAQPTEVTAVGNWRAIGQRLGRRLASIGAQLVHSAPATGVKDWSDLWIAVAAGCWLGQAKPGDVLEIVSNDRAFDAVGDAAAARGVIYRRLLHKRGASAAAAAAAAEEEPKRRRRSRGGRRRRGRGSGAPLPAHEELREAPVHEAPHAKPAHRPPAHAAPPPAAAHPALHDAEAHGATRDQIISVIRRLSGNDSQRWINLDVLEKALKAEGFSRPPGSPRLVTRLRMLKDVEVDAHGRARLATAAPAVEEPAPAPAAEAAGETATPPKKPRRRRTRTPAGGGAAGDAGGAGAGDTEAAPFAAASGYSDPPAE